MKFIVFDTETVGLPGAMGTVNGRRVKSNGEIIQFSAIVCNSSKEIEDFISFYCMPNTSIKLFLKKTVGTIGKIRIRTVYQIIILYQR